MEHDLFVEPLAFGLHAASPWFLLRPHSFLTHFVLPHVVQMQGQTDQKTLAYSIIKELFALTIAEKWESVYLRAVSSPA